MRAIRVSEFGGPEVLVPADVPDPSWLAHCLGGPGMLAGPMAEMVGMVRAGTLRPVVGGTYPMWEARRAHIDLRARRTTGKLVLDLAS